MLSQVVPLKAVEAASEDGTWESDAWLQDTMLIARRCSPVTRRSNRSRSLSYQVWSFIDYGARIDRADSPTMARRLRSTPISHPSAVFGSACSQFRPIPR